MAPVKADCLGPLPPSPAVRRSVLALIAIARITGVGVEQTRRSGVLLGLGVGNLANRTRTTSQVPRKDATVTDRPTIALEIEAMVGGNFHAWSIGITNDPIQRKKHLRDAMKRDVSHWQQWRADSLSDAQAIERSNVANGMPSESDSMATDSFPAYVYIF